ncbi:type 1 glutamine amidotransferase domain-containing protein [Blastomonas sp. AAP53]|uniref:type 1 glutamine amidotransferase domain-containing protein n=1 Tax=Blastomonas sp. AAP53 TaxID=1248760 RepID=UPI00031737AB|nr:type 1 glutamine amidotransferase domain-containing protein [Blastomonas sp. AAP53]
MTLPDLTGRRICILATHGFEQSELIQPRDDLKGAGATVTIVSPESGEIRGWKGDDWGQSVSVDAPLDGAKAEDFDALVLPGGQINPDLLRVDETAMALITSFADAGKPIAAVCHAPWLLIEAGLVEGKTLTCYNSIRTDLKNAGANYVDQEVAVDGNLITSRNPDDLPAFGEAIAKMVSEMADARSETV